MKRKKEKSKNIFFYKKIKYRKRFDTRKIGEKYLAEGNLEQAKSKFIESYDVSPKMAYNFIKVKFF